MNERTPRPLSPHLQVYRLPMLALLSIAHRVTGVALYLGLILLACWLIAAASSSDAFALMQALLASVLGKIAMIGMTFALIYHLLNGVRHLFWDAGRGFELEQAELSGWLVVIMAAILTAVTWALALA